MRVYYIEIFAFAQHTSMVMASSSWSAGTLYIYVRVSFKVKQHFSSKSVNVFSFVNIYGAV